MNPSPVQIANKDVTIVFRNNCDSRRKKHVLQFSDGWALCCMYMEYIALCVCLLLSCQNESKNIPCNQNVCFTWTCNCQSLFPIHTSNVSLLNASKSQTINKHFSMGFVCLIWLHHTLGIRIENEIKLLVHLLFNLKQFYNGYYRAW